MTRIAPKRTRNLAVSPVESTATAIVSGRKASPVASAPKPRTRSR